MSSFIAFKLLITSTLDISILENINIKAVNIKYENKDRNELSEEKKIIYNIELENYIKNKDIKQITSKLYFFGNIIINPSIKYIKNLIIGSFHFNNIIYYYYTFVLHQIDSSNNIQIQHPIIICPTLETLLSIYLHHNDLKLLEAWFKVRMIGYFIFDKHIRIYDDCLDFYRINLSILKRYYNDYLKYCQIKNYEWYGSLDDYKLMNNIY